MKKTINTFAFGILLLLPALNYGQLLASAEKSESFVTGSPIDKTPLNNRHNPAAISFPSDIIIESVSHSKLSGCYLTSNKKTLLVAYEQQKNTFGDGDIYVSFLTKNNQWSKPANLGQTINTGGTESSPFLSEDDSTLYYTSTNTSQNGVSEIYASRRLDDSWQNWSEPKNLGPKINSDNQQSFFIVSDGKMTFSSPCGPARNLDLFALTMPEVAEQATVSETANETVAVSSTEIALSVILFDHNKCELKKEAIYELDRVAGILKASPALQMEISGHTDNMGSKKYNKQLSRKRLNAILFYFKNQTDLDEKRFTVKNYGETMPVADNTTEKGRELNRRVEMKAKPGLLN